MYAATLAPVNTVFFHDYCLVILSLPLKLTGNLPQILPHLYIHKIRFTLLFSVTLHFSFQIFN